MNLKSFGQNLAILRKKCGINQSELAELLSVTNKTVSKWETGRGYPEITTIPLLAKVLDVSIADLFETEKSGITAVGTICIDYLRNINWFPGLNSGTEILDSHTSEIKYAGGCVATTLGNIRSIDSKINLNAVCKLGVDENGRYLLSYLQQKRIGVSQIKMISTSNTATTNVYMDKSTKNLSYFYSPGSNNMVVADDINLKAINSKILCVGHVMQLNGLYENDERYGFRIGGVLDEAQKNGIITALVFTAVVNPELCCKMLKSCLKHTNFFITGIQDGTYMSGQNEYGNKDISYTQIINSLNYYMDMGVSNAVILYDEDRTFMMDSDRKVIQVSAIVSEEESDVHLLGYGGGFTAGFLYALHEKYPLRECLEIATAGGSLVLKCQGSVMENISFEDLLHIAFNAERKNTLILPKNKNI